MKLRVHCFTLITISLVIFAACLLDDPHAIASPAPKPILVLREGLNGEINEWTGPAKFALYEDGTLFTETSDETSDQGGEPRYYKTRLTTKQMEGLIRSFGLDSVMRSPQKEFGQGEGVTWQLIYWRGNSKQEITVIDSLAKAPPAVAALVKKLEKYPHSGTRYLAYNYLLYFGNPYPITKKTILWPKNWTFIKFSKPMLTGMRESDMSYEYRIDAPHAIVLHNMLKGAGTDCVSINGQTWQVRLAPAPRLPNDLMWVSNPIG